MRAVIFWIAARFRDLLNINSPLVYDSGEPYPPDGDWHLWQDFGGEG